MPVHITACHPAVKANRNRIALTRGPFVLCAEGVDNGGTTQRFFFASREHRGDSGWSPPLRPAWPVECRRSRPDARNPVRIRRRESKP
ncbi:hypothetical protein [Stieleria neptunia]|uniref:hypothetical protein n=1 Tax=Stieleria neptunia TaxID=2527979 RepID=UPI0036F2AD0F